METLNHPYRPKPWAMVGGCAFFGAGALFMAHTALTNDRGLVINGLIRLAPNEAAIFYWGVAIVSAAFVVVALPALAVGLLSTQRVTLTDSEISAPKFAFSRTPVVVRLADVLRLSMQEVHRQRFLIIHHAHGKLTITESCMPNRMAFEELCSAMASRVPQPLPKS